MKTATIAHSSKPELAAAVAEIRATIGQDAGRLVLYFASPAYAPDALAPAMAAAFQSATVIGCTTAGELVSGAMLKRSLVAMAFPPGSVADVAVEVLPGLSTGQDPVPAALQRLEARLGAPVRSLDPARHVGLLLIDGLSGAEERVMESLGARVDLPIVGGSAGDDLAFRATRVFAGGEAHRDAALLAVLRLERGYQILKTQSFDALGRTLTATRVDEKTRTVLEFDGRPAVEAYAAALGVAVNQLAGEFMSHPLGLMAGREPFVRSPQQVVGTAVKFYCAIQEGMELEVLRSRDIVAETRRALALAQGEGGGLAAVVNFNCILRTLELEKQGTTAEYGAVFSDLPTIGFSTYGESYLGHINQTATMLLLR